MSSTLGALIVLAASAAAQAGVVSTTDPSLPNEIGARVRWGASGFEASLFDSSPFGQSPTMNPGGSPVWQLNAPYAFEVSFDSSTGTLGLKVDFNRDSSFGTGESITRNVFGGAITDYTGIGFNYLSISGNEGGSTARSQVSDLVINGTSFANMAPNGTYIESFWTDSAAAPLGSVLITGKLTYLTAGTAQERPSWNFNFKGAEDIAAVPLPPAGWLGLAGLAGLAALRRRRRSA